MTYLVNMIGAILNHLKYMHILSYGNRFLGTKEGGRTNLDKRAIGFWAIEVLPFIVGQIVLLSAPLNCCIADDVPTETVAVPLSLKSPSRKIHTLMQQVGL